MEKLLETYKGYKILLSHKVNQEQRGWVALKENGGGFCDNSQVPEEKLLEIAKKTVDQHGN